MCGSDAYVYLETFHFEQTATILCCESLTLYELLRILPLFTQ